MARSANGNQRNVEPMVPHVSQDMEYPPNANAVPPIREGTISNFLFRKNKNKNTPARNGWLTIRIDQAMGKEKIKKNIFKG